MRNKVAYSFIYIHTHTHTHTYIYIYIYIITFNFQKKEYVNCHLHFCLGTDNVAFLTTPHSTMKPDRQSTKTKKIKKTQNNTYMCVCSASVCLKHHNECILLSACSGRRWSRGVAFTLKAIVWCWQEFLLSPHVFFWAVCVPFMCSGSCSWGDTTSPSLGSLIFTSPLFKS